ncbi:hypothetical protein WN48_00270 [Eufriesea mexicana]|nr:hypothetical protein WN48_00270 [Eufriesea mexicana]
MLTNHVTELGGSSFGSVIEEWVLLVEYPSCPATEPVDFFSATHSSFSRGYLNARPFDRLWDDTGSRYYPYLRREQWKRFSNCQRQEGWTNNPRPGWKCFNDHVSARGFEKIRGPGAGTFESRGGW